MNQQDIEQVVKAVLLKMQSSDTPPAAVHEMGVFASLDDAVAAAKVAQQGLKSVAMRQLAIAAIREAGEKHARDLAELAVSETGMGRVEDKFAKNVAQARGTPGVECLSPQVLTGDNGLTLIENAPWGVVASVTPSTNPAATVINNAISLIAAGNSVIFAPHPAAKKVSQRAITLLNQAIVAAGGPENLLVTVANPDIETAQRLFKFPGIGLLVVTGGEAVVEAARKHTNKRLIAAGAGNPPVVVDETADLARAAQSIVKGASFDNNIICADEKVLIVVDSVADELMRLMEGQHAVKLTAEQAQQLQSVLLKNIDERGKGTVSRDWVGRDAAKIAAAIGLKVPEQTRLLFVETTAEHPFAVTELMMPVLPVVRVANVADAIALAVKLSSPGPVIFRQTRYGMDGKPIKVWKFRSMKVMENDKVVTQATQNDPRVTKVGNFLRRTSLDELPQFINVLTGGMSIVGPRPHAVAHNEQYRQLIEGYMLRHKVKPGITGWAQINGWRGETDTLEKMEKRVEFDLEYIREWSVWFDIKIVFLTVFKGFVNKAAY